MEKAVWKGAVYVTNTRAGSDHQRVACIIDEWICALMVGGVSDSNAEGPSGHWTTSIRKRLGVSSHLRRTSGYRHPAPPRPIVVPSWWSAAVHRRR